MAKNAVVVKFLADVDGLKKGVDGVNGKLNGFSKSIKAFALTFAAAFSVDKIVQFGKASVDAFSDFEEAAGKVGQVFQDQAGQVEDWANGAVTAIGLSSQAALEAAGTFGNLFTAFGVGIPEAKEMSLTLTELAADLASFNNTSIDQALTALRSGLSGETEPLKRFGVALNQAAIETEALNLGLIKNKNELDQAAKSQAIYSLIMKQTTNAQGDFKRTQEGLANTQRTLNAAFEEAQKTIGEGLYYALLDLVDAVGGPNGAAETIDVLATRIGLWVEGAAVAVTATGELEGKVKDTGRETRRLADEFEANGGSVRAWWELIKDVTADDSTISILEVIGLVNRRTRNTEQLFQDLRKVKFADHLSGELEATERAARAVEIQANSANRSLRRLFLSNENDVILREERQGDSFLRKFNDGDAAMRQAKEEARELAQEVDDLGRSYGGATRAIEDNSKKVKEFGVAIGDYTLTIAQKGKKGAKITEEAVSTMTAAYQEFFKEIEAELARAEAQLAETQQFIANATANLLGPTSLKAVQQQYGAAQTEAERLTREYERQLKTRRDLEERARRATGDEKNALLAQAKTAAEAASETKRLAQEQQRLVDRGFVGFWEDAQKEVENYQKSIQELVDFFNKDGVLTDTEATIIQDLFTLPPDQGQTIITDLLKQTDATMRAVGTQESLRTSTEAFVQGITDVFEGYGEFPSLGYTNAKKWVSDIDAYLRDPKTKRDVRKAAKSMLPKGLKIKVGWELEPFPQNQFRPTASASTATIQSIQDYERRNGSKWRERVR